MAGEGLPVQVATRVLRVPARGYYEWLTRPPSPRSVRHAWLTDQIRTVHLVELLDRKRWHTRIELANAMFEYLEIWPNRRRRHSALGWLSPIEFEARNKVVVTG